jgi:23S rRNA (uracil1939-C5)-methyltransferase
LSRRKAAVRRAQVNRLPEEALIVDLAHDGRGVARIDGKTVFVADALPGETVRLVRSSFHATYDEARLEYVLTPSADRVAPQCIHFGLCGGCALQHLSPVKQLEFKQRQLTEAFERIGKVTPAAVLPPLQGDVWRYRRRARLGAKWVARKDKVLVGFRERGTPFLAELKSCAVLQQPLDELLLPLAELIGSLSLKERIPQIEVAVADNATALVFRTLGDLTQQDLGRLREFAAAHGVQVYLQPGNYSTVAALDVPVTPLVYRLPRFDIEIEFLPADFIQVNGDLNRRMVEQAVDLLAPTVGDHVLDLFCGLGNFSLPLARHAAQVVGVDGEAGLIERARANAQRNGIDNVTFYAANLAEAPDVQAWAHLKFGKVLLDPPRAGAAEVLPVIARSGARRVVYISCHPASLARDAGLLVREHGFTLKAAGVMDMFAHTAHVESIALFERR